MRRGYVYATALLAVFILTPMMPALAEVDREVPEHLRAPEGVDESEFRKIYREGTNLQLIYRAIYEDVRPSVVRIVAEVTPRRGQQVPEIFNDPFFRKFFPAPPKQSRKMTSFGTGFIIDESGLIVTNSHVVGDATVVKIHLHDGRELDGRVKGGDELTDVALVELKGVSDLKAVKFGDSEGIKVGDIAIAVGNPFGLDGTFTTGVISGLHRANLDESGLRFIQTDASINQGNSGGPLLNLRGEVIGINRMIYSPSGGSIGIGFAIPLGEVQPVIKQLASKGQVDRPLLGVKIDAARADRGAQVPGALVVEVIGGSSAHDAGIIAGDLIVKIDGTRIKSPVDLVRYIQSRTIGDSVEIELMRKDQAVKVEAKLKKM